MQPLAERMRPKTLEEYVGQKHLIGEGSVLRNSIESKHIPSFILWGPPGVGKTSLAQLFASVLKSEFYAISAVNAGVKDIRDVLDKAKDKNLFSSSRPILFIDEIHRFSKSQQDSLLKAVEDGTVTLIGATTENPSFEVISPLLSRCQVYILEPLTKEELVKMVDDAAKNDTILSKKNIEVKEYEALLQISGGDARKLYNALELVSNQARNEKFVITNELVKKVCQNNMAIYDKAGEMHYDIASAFIKSIRGSDPNAAVYWLARMLAGGEDVKFIARRLVILAAEDVGLANPNGLVLAQAAFDSIHKVGMPEARIILSQTVIYLATSQKSNSAYAAIDNALDLVKRTGDLPVPLHIRNAPTELMKELGYHKGYKYSHDYESNFEAQEYLPDRISGTKLYEAQDNQHEEKVKLRLKELWKDKYDY